MKTKEEIEQEILRVRVKIRQAQKDHDWDSFDKYSAWIAALLWVRQPSKNNDNSNNKTQPQPGEASPINSEV
jgi:hypothetical protein